MKTKTRNRLLLFFIFAFIVLSAAPSPTPQAAPQTAAPVPIVARITLRNSEEIGRFTQLGLDLLEMRQGNDLLFLTSTEQIQELRAKGWDVRVDQKQTDLFSRQQATNTFRSGYR